MFPLRNVQSLLESVNHLWNRISRQGDRLRQLELKIMSLQEDIQVITQEVTELRAAIAAERAEVSDAIKVLSDKVIELEAAIAAGSPDLSGVIQGLKDATAEVKAIVEPAI